MEDAFYNQIESYLNGELSEDAKRDFESMIASDADLSEDVDVFISIKRFFEENSWDFDSPSTVDKVSLKTLETYFQSKENKDFEEKIRKIQKEYNNKADTSRRYFLMYAAILSGILLVISYFYFSTQTNNLELYADYANYKDLPSISSRNTGDETLKIAKEYFNNKQYDKAVVNFRDYIEKQENINPSVFIYLAFSLSEDDRYREALQAIDSFEKLNNLDGDMANWYKALIFLKEDDLINTEKYLSRIIINENNYKYKEARELLKEIK